jgi:hypothetical protein
MTMHPTPPLMEPAGATATNDRVDAYLLGIQRWSAETGAKLLDLDAILGTLPKSSQQDHTLAFVIWRAVDERINEAGAVQSAFPEKRLEPLRGALFASDRSTLAGSLDEAVQIICALIDATQQVIDTHEGTVATSAAIMSNLAAAAPLVKSLSMGASLHSRLLSEASSPNLGSDPTKLGQLASQAATLLTDLEAADRERTKLLAELPQDSIKVEQLRILESEAKSVAETSLAKIANQPKLGIVSVNALGGPPDLDALAEAPWPAQRTQLHDRATKLSRAEASLRHVIKTHSDLLAERNELRQVVDAFRAKAMAGRIGELPQVSRAYDHARQILWGAPTDLVEARKAVAAYQVTISAHMHSGNVNSGGVSSGGVSSGGVSSGGVSSKRPASEVPK